METAVKLVETALKFKNLLYSSTLLKTDAIRSIIIILVCTCDFIICYAIVFCIFFILSSFEIASSPLQYIISSPKSCTFLVLRAESSNNLSHSYVRRVWNKWYNQKINRRFLHSNIVLITTELISY